MEKVILKSANGVTLTMTVEDQRFIFCCEIPEGEVWVYALDPPEAHKVLEAISQYLVETP